MTPSPSQNGTSAATEQPHLKRLLTVKDLVFFGIVLIQPIAPVGIFGIASEKSHGQVSATIVIGMIAMMLTAFSYGRMASLYPSAGSAYTYVSRGLGAHLGFLAGWAMCSWLSHHSAGEHRLWLAYLGTNISRRSLLQIGPRYSWRSLRC